MQFIVTGASSGIGFAAARSLAIRNNNVISVARNTKRLESLKVMKTDRIKIIPADLSTESGLSSVVKHAKSIGTIDGIIHAAGSLISPTEYRDLNAEEILASLNIHVTVPITLNNTLEDQLAGGRVLYIDSYSSSNLRVGWSGYSIVKAAAQMAARAAAAEMKKSTVIRVFPGAVNTPLIETLLSSEHASPTYELFKGLKLNGELLEPKVVGEFIANILVHATDQQLEERETWDISNPSDHLY